MRWVVVVEAALIVLAIGYGVYCQLTGGSADERAAAAIYYIAAIVLIVILAITLGGWWAWVAAFRGLS